MNYDDRIKNIRSLNSTEPTPVDPKPKPNKGVGILSIFVTGGYLVAIMAILHILWNYVIAPDIHLPQVSWYFMPTAMLFYHLFNLNLFSYFKK